MKNTELTGQELYNYAKGNCTAFNGFPLDGSEGYTHEPERTFFRRWLKPGIGQVGVPVHSGGRYDTLYVPVKFTKR